jgi:hypothetical protein
MAGHLLFNSGSNESSLAPQFKWLDNTFKAARGIHREFCQHRREHHEGEADAALEVPHRHPLHGLLLLAALLQAGVVAL